MNIWFGYRDVVVCVLDVVCLFRYGEEGRVDGDGVVFVRGGDQG